MKLPLTPLELRVALYQILALMMLGLVIDWPEQVSALTLFVTFHVASLAGMAYAGWVVWRRLKTPHLRLAYVLVAFVGWRISYFAFMVFAGTFAALVEQVQVATTGMSLFIYPSYLVAFSGLHLLVGFACFLPFSGWRWWPLVAIPLVLHGAMISFTAWEDARLLPDHTWHIPAEELPPASLPESNPYLVALEEHDYSLWQRLLPFAAGSTYDSIPDTPWARIVQGTLEADFRRQPRASSSARVLEHYYGYLRAHPMIGRRDPHLEEAR